MILTFLLLLSALLSSGCEYQTIRTRSSWDELRKLGGKDRDWDTALQTPDAPQEQGYAVLLESFTGPDRQIKAQRLLARLLRETKLPDIWIKDTGVMVYVLCGRFPQPDVDDAKRILDMAQNVKLDGTPTFAAASIVPAASPDKPVVSSPWDLRKYPGMYSLQIAFYDETFGPNFRKAALDAVATLRKEGVEAYYYQGPLRALVTVGLFTDDDFIFGEGGAYTYGPRVQELQRKFPHNLGNGRLLMQKISGQDAGAQPSFLVRASAN